MWISEGSIVQHCCLSMQEVIIEERYATAKGLLAIFLKFVITEEPITFQLEEIYEAGAFPILNNKKLVIKTPKTYNDLQKWTAYFCFGFSDLIFGRNPSIFSLTLILPIIFIGAWQLKKSKRKIEYEYITFYRLLGLIELPGYDTFSPFMIRFTDLRAVIRTLFTSNYYSGPLLVFIINFQKIPLWKRFFYEDYRTLSWHPNPMAYWSFYVWYMDKNRPLPPGTALDPYRQKDFERRKAEGFPSPLFESKIPTPEWEPEKDVDIRG